MQGVKAKHVQSASPTPTTYRHETVTRPEDTQRPRRYQTLAARAAVRALAHADCTTIAMPWGSGKTWAAILAAERLAPAGEPVAHLVPNARHVAMARREWQRRTGHTVLAVCVPPINGHAPREQHQGYDQIAHDAISTSAELGQALEAAPRPVVIGPYDSLALIHEARRTFAVALLDEVHRTASPGIIGKERIDWTQVHDRHRLSAAKRIGLSARPGTTPPTGPVAYRLRYQAAVRAGVLPAYQVVVAVARDEHRARTLLAPSTGDELVLGPGEPDRNVLDLVGYVRGHTGRTVRYVLAALASSRPALETLAHALRTQDWLRAPLEALASADERFARALDHAREGHRSRTALLTVLGARTAQAPGTRQGQVHRTPRTASPGRTPYAKPDSSTDTMP